FQAEKKSLLLGPIRRKVSGNEPIAAVKRPPRMAFGEPIRGSSSLVSHLMSGGKGTGLASITNFLGSSSDGAAAYPGLAEATRTRMSAERNRIMGRLLVPGVLFRIEGLPHRLA